MPQVMCLMGHRNSQSPRLSETMSATTLLAGSRSTTPVRMPLTVMVWPLRGVQINFDAHAHDVPAAWRPPVRVIIGWLPKITRSR